MITDSSSSTALKLRAYQAELHQTQHAHDNAHLSLILSGSLVEEVHGHEQRVFAGMYTMRLPGFTHQVSFGSRGTLILSADINRDMLRGLGGIFQGSWSRASDNLVRAVLHSALASHPPETLEDAMWDAVAEVPRRGEIRRASHWLIRSRDRLVEENVEISALAREAGVHRVHFSREFTKAFGLPPSLFRKRARGLRATSGAITGRAANESVYDYGFADQSHMARSIKQLTGTTYMKLRTLAHKVTSVQD